MIWLINFCKYMPPPRQCWFSIGSNDSPRLGYTLLVFGVLLGSMLSGWGGTFPLPIPQLPTSIPLERPSIVGTLVAWGDNSYGQLTPPPGLTDAVAITAGFYHSAALRADGSVVVWGDPAFGQTNVPAAAQSGVVAIAAGKFTAALKEDGSVVEWGDNRFVQTQLPPEGSPTWWQLRWAVITPWR